MARLYGQVVNVVSKPPEQRTPEDAISIVGWFRKKSRLFGELASDVVCDIVRNCQFETKTRDDILIKQGDYGDCFYILLRGRVSIYILTSLADGEDVDETVRKMREADQQARASSPRQHLDRSKFGNFIVQLEEGQSFGELALISKECIRNASIIVDESSDLLVVDRKLYNRSLKTAQMADFEQRNQFVSTCPLFRWWQPRYKRQMAYSIVKETVSFHEFIYKQGQPVDKIYFILSGQGRVTVNPERHWHQYTQLLLERDEAEDGHDSGPDRPQERRTLRRPTTAPPVGGRKRCHLRKDVELCLIGVNEILGAAEFVLGLKTYYESVQTTEACEMYSLDLKHYDRLIVRRHLRTLDVLKNTVRARLQNRIQRMPVDRCALFRLLLQKLRTEPKAPTTQTLITKKKPEASASFSSKASELQRNRRNKNLLLRGGQRAAGEKTTESDDVTLIQDISKNCQEEDEVGDMREADRLQRECADEEHEKEHHQDSVTLHDFPYETASSGDEDAAFERPNSQRRSKHHHRDSPTLNFNGGEFHDWETSDAALADLETRIKHWISDVSGSSSTRSGRPRAVAMRRVTIDTGVKVRPGAKVIVSKKPDRPHTASPRARPDVRGAAVNKSTAVDSTVPLHVTFARGLETDAKGSLNSEPNRDVASDFNLQTSSLPKRKKSHQYSLDEYNALKEQLPMNLRPRRNSRKPDEL